MSGGGFAGLREVEWTDIPALADLERELFPDDSWSEASWWSELAGRPRRDYVLVERDGEIAAYAGLDHAGSVADLMTIAVSPSARGAGLGARLLAEVEARAQRAGAEAIMLEVRADNLAARAMYDRHAYAVLRHRKGYYQPGGVDAVIMRKLLGERKIEQ